MIGRTLGLYIGTRFAKTILGVFGGFFALIFLVDFVELLRRSGDIAGISPFYIAALSFLRVPSVTEQVLPFAVLFGAMVSLLNLSRKLELVVARAAGVSVWQFLTPPLAVAVFFGLFSVTVYNPLSATMKQQAERIETGVFGRTGQSGTDSGLWIRQRSIDGQAIIRAENSSDRGTILGRVTAFVYEPDGQFLERIEATRAELYPGFWMMEDARIISPGEEPRDTKSYLLSTNLSAAQVTQSFVAPDTVPFWSLPAVKEQTQQAGLDARAYELRYQTLLARPLFLVAMVLVAASFSLKFFRMGGIARNVLGGVVAGFVLYVVTKLVSDMGSAGLLSAPVAAWTPPVIGAMLGSLVLLQQEDG